MMVTITCRTRQALQIGEDVEITIIEIEPGLVRLGICAPGRCLTRLDPVPLPIGTADFRLIHFEDASEWPHGSAGGKS